MIISVVVLAVLALSGWLIFRSVKGKSITAHFVIYSIAIMAGIFTYAYFLSLDFPQLIKVVVSILLGIISIVLAALRQSHLANRGQNPSK